MAVDTGDEADNESVTDRSAKRKQRTSPETTNNKSKRKRETGPTPPSSKENKQHPENANQSKSGTDWQVVPNKKERKNQRGEQLKTQFPMPSQPKKARRLVARPNALIVRPKEKEKYAEMLCKVKKGVPDDQVRTTVDKIRRTATGDLLIVLTKENTDGGQELQKTIANLLKDDANVICKGPQEDLEIRDLDDITTKEDILAALQMAAGEECQISLDAIRSLRKAYRGTQTAIVTLPVPIAKKVLCKYGKIKIGWVNCRIKTVERPTKCFRCWHYGHFANQCKSEVDRSKLCTRCGVEGHKIAECKKEARCVLCVENGDTESFAHHAGNSRCPLFQKALQKIQKNRK